MPYVAILVGSLLSAESTLRGLPGITRRKVEMTSSQYGLYAQGDTRVTMDVTKGCQPARGS